MPPITYMGLSAGTSIVVFSLEQLPANYKVEDVVLFGASTSSTYDLTRALRRVNDKMYVFTSENDSVLKFLVPMSGTADRASGTVPAAGLNGFRLPAGASPATRQLYTKVVTDPLASGVSETRVRRRPYRRPQPAVRSGPRRTAGDGQDEPIAVASTRGKVRNPDYERLAKFGVGSYVMVEGEQMHRGVRIQGSVQNGAQEQERIDSWSSGRITSMTTRRTSPTRCTA